MTDMEEKKGKEIVTYGPREAGIPVKHGEASSEVKSITEVRHGIVHFLTEFSPLQRYTNLNIPPSNWLRTSSKLERHVRDMTWNNSKKTSQFSSFEMAHNSPDIAGEVDVISNATNIKQLLKIPFEQSHISMMVHRVGKSLLLDEFDIHKHLLRQEQTEWEWLRQFYYESVLRDLHAKMKCVPRPSKTRDNLQSRNMYSKFLYHSLCESQNKQLAEEVSGSSVEMDQQISGQDKMLIPDPLPQPMGTQFHREVLWTFEDIKMLIGTDLPVFCDDSYYVSLRLKDMLTPINVLTGLDCWLDNLMCNVPEVAMCFHVDGIVQKYEIMKTFDIPDMENSKFDPGVVTDIAKNILTFLKNNATKEGHTYWLYKGTHDDVVKLYDLTMLCDDSQGNPFTQPLGMLLYRVARNMWTSRSPGKAAHIRTLLENCLFLLDDKKHPQVCTSANFLLSDVFVPDKTLDDDWSLPGSSEDSSDDESTQEWDDSYQATTFVDVDTLSKASKMNRSREVVRLKVFNEDETERCREAIKHIQKGLTVLESDLRPEGHQSTSIVEEQARCKSDEAIPLHYEPLNKPNPQQTAGARTSTSETGAQTSTSEALSCTLRRQEDGSTDSDQLQMTSVTPDDPYKDHTWHSVSRALLFRKGSYTFTAIAKKHFNDKDYLGAITYLRLALSCFEAAQLGRKGPVVKDNLYLLSHLYSLVGDLRLVLAKQVDCPVVWDDHLAKLTNEERSVLEMAEKLLDCSEFAWMLDHSSEVDENLRCCVKCYSHALEQLPKSNRPVYVSFCKRKGNAQNELGVWYMNRSQTLLQSKDIGHAPSEEIQELWSKSKSAFVEGIALFEEAGDKANQVLLHCNLGRLMRLCAHTHAHISMKAGEHEIRATERHYFDMAIDYYTTALTLSEQGYKDVRQSIVWELSTTYFNMACLLQDYAPLSHVKKEEVEKEIITLMNKSLKYCKMETSTGNEPLNLYRSATINHRLASLFHSSIRAECPDQKKRHLRQLSENHYTRSIEQFRHMDCHIECLRILLEYLKLQEFCLPAEIQARNRHKALLEMLHTVLDCQASLGGFIGQLDDKDYGSDLQEEGETITKILQSRVQFILLQLLKTYKALHSKKREKSGCTVDEVKTLYAASIHTSSGKEQATTLRDRCAFLHTLLSQVSKFYEKNLGQDTHLS